MKIFQPVINLFMFVDFRLIFFGLKFNPIGSFSFSMSRIRTLSKNGLNLFVCDT